MLLGPFAFGPGARQQSQWECVMEEGAHLMATRKQRHRKASDRYQYTLQVHAPSDLTSSYWAPPLKSSATPNSTTGLGLSF